VQSSKAYSEQLGKRRAAIETKKKAEFADKPLPPTLERELDSINSELARQDALLTLKQNEVVAVNAKYDADKKRWRELIAAKGGDALAGGDVPAAPAASKVGTAPQKK
jgi:hypothetical protein